MDNTNFDHDAWLTTREAADLIGCGERNMLRLIKSGEIDAHKDGHSYRVSLKSARAYKQSEANQRARVVLMVRAQFSSIRKVPANGMSY